MADYLILAGSVTQMIDYLRREEIDAAIVFGTDAWAAGDTIRSVEILETTEPIVYCIAVTLSSRNQETAIRFSDHLLGEQGQAVLAGFGFGRP
jgi:molybdate transport system substrate-binding protein